MAHSKHDLFSYNPTGFIGIDVNVLNFRFVTQSIFCHFRWISSFWVERKKFNWIFVYLSCYHWKNFREKCDLFWTILVLKIRLILWILLMIFQGINSSSSKEYDWWERPIGHVKVIYNMHTWCWYCVSGAIDVAHNKFHPNNEKYDEIDANSRMKVVSCMLNETKQNQHSQFTTPDSVKSVCQNDRNSKFMIQRSANGDDKYTKRPPTDAVSMAKANVNTYSGWQFLQIFLLILSHVLDPFYLVIRVKSQRIIPSYESEISNARIKRNLVFVLFYFVDFLLFSYDGRALANCFTKNTSNDFDYIWWRSLARSWRHNSMSTKDSHSLFSQSRFQFGWKALNWRG